MRAIPSGHGYSVMTPVRHSLPRASLAGARSCAKSAAVLLTRYLRAYVDEGGSNDHPRAEILCYKEYPLRNSHLPVPPCKDWKESA